MRFALFYVYAQADLVTSIKKNDLRGTAEVEFNGFVIAEAKGLESKLDVAQGERAQDSGLSIQVRESTARKLKDIWARWQKDRTWYNLSRLIGYFQWFANYNPWVRAHVLKTHVLVSMMLVK